MKTIVSLALAGLMSISALLPALAAQEAESVSIAESSSISESMAQDESSVSSSGSTADESTAPESGSNAGADVSQPESDSMPVKSDGSTSDGSEAETSSSLPVSDSMASDEMDADSEPASGSETAESDVDTKDEDSSGVTAATADEQSVSVTVSEEYAILLATVPFPVSWTVKMKKKQKETHDILSYHTQAAGCSDKARAKASGGRQPIEECGRTGL